MIGDCAEQLQQEKARLDKLCADNGIAESPRYTNPTDFKARITSPQIAQFVELIRLLDQLMIAMDNSVAVPDINQQTMFSREVSMATTHTPSGAEYCVDRTTGASGGLCAGARGRSAFSQGRIGVNG